jgi:PhnB protein
MTTVNVYLTFNRNCEEAFNFYKSVFGGEFPYIGHFRDMPPGGGKPVPKEDENLVMHVSLPISNETVLMGSDVGGEWAADYQLGNNFSLSVKTDTRMEADRLFNSLSTGGKVTMPMNKTFWGDYFGMFTDQFGINWMVSYNEEPQQQQEAR